MAELLVIEGLTAGYGEAIVIEDVSLTLAEGRVLAVLGRNGMGKSTLVASIVGVTRHRGGRVYLEGRDITERSPDQRAALGIGWVPQERNIFRSLTVEENMTAVARHGPWTVDRVYALFPRLAERRRNLGVELSGGEQQMLAIARALVLNPRLLLLDEPFEGLAPIIVEELRRSLGDIVRDQALGAILVEQNPARGLAMSDDALILERGGVAHRGASARLAREAAILERFLGVGGEG